MTQRTIYILVLLVLLIPLVFQKVLPPARMASAERVYERIETLNTGKGFALVALDFGPGTLAENKPQAEVIIEHLFRRNIPIITFTSYALGERFSIDVPKQVAEKLNKEGLEKPLVYGDAWISLGYRAGTSIFLQALAKSDDIGSFLKKDVTGQEIKSFPRFSSLRKLSDISIAAQFTGLVGMLDGYIQFLQRSDYVPPLIHGCTSITIPEAYIYLDSGQLKGALEGIAGAAWYSHLLTNAFLKREVDAALITNTALGVGHLAIMALILLGNYVYFTHKRQRV